jgi:hypothetical protein
MGIAEVIVKIIEKLDVKQVLKSVTVGLVLVIFLPADFFENLHIIKKLNAENNLYVLITIGLGYSLVVYFIIEMLKTILLFIKNIIQKFKETKTKRYKAQLKELEYKEFF